MSGGREFHGGSPREPGDGTRLDRERIAMIGAGINGLVATISGASRHADGLDKRDGRITLFGHLNQGRI